MPDFFENLTYNAGAAFCGFLWNITEGLEKVVERMKVDESLLDDTLPKKLVEKKRKTPRPVEGVFTCLSLKTVEVTEEQIKVHRILDGFDETSIRRVKARIVDACKFILGNAESGVERQSAQQLARMLWKGAVVIIDADLLMNKHIMGCFYTTEGIPYIGLDISEIQNADNAVLVNTLVHEAYHAWRHFSSDTEYSIVDEKRAWNTALYFSNKYRRMYGFPIEREQAYTEGELLKHADYLWNANVNIRYGPGESILENILYGIGNAIMDATDVVDGWNDKIFEWSFKD
jgi:hypothetical protein